jgi:hypothetical protein
MANGKGYATVYWGKMPVNFRPRAFRQSEVEEAVRQAERDFPDVLDLVPDFSLLSVNRDPERNAVAVLRPGHEGRPMDFRRVAGREEGNLPELLRRVARHVRSLRGQGRPASRSSTG